jgi:hypothetical protein
MHGFAARKEEEINTVSSIARPRISRLPASNLRVAYISVGHAIASLRYLNGDHR